ncbi:HlyD family secretion protein [Salmonella enterica]|nr:HlyD family secretion protein [Salmonella enterica]EEJ9028850.1 HlyD family secretion protein [Salmonella enterica subsp. enterica]ELC5052869.1 HlyD family secretion protein [Salmonella enterica]
MFRKEAIQNRQLTWNGKALLISRIPASIYMFSCVFFIFLFIYIIFNESYTRRVTVSGEVTSFPRPINIYSDVQGFVTEKFISDGSMVKKNAPLYQIDVSKSTIHGIVSNRQRADILEQITQIDNIINGLKDSKNTAIIALKKQKEQYLLSYKNSSDILKKAEIGTNNLKINMENYRKYQLKGLITKDQLINQEVIYYQQQNNMLGLNSQNEQNLLQLNNIESQIRMQASEFDNRIYQATLQRYELRKELINTEKESAIIIRALSEGKIDSVSVSIGQMINQGDSIAQIIPEKIVSYYIVLWVPNTAIPYISTGDIANISYEAFPVGKFGQFSGVIESISRTPATPQEMSTYQGAPKPISSQSIPYYKVLVKPTIQSILYDNKTRPLENGMKTQATLFLEKRKIWQWILSPFYDIKRSTKGPLNGK